jgi:hypothetical protein
MFHIVRPAALAGCAELALACGDAAAPGARPSLASLTLFASTANDLTARGDTLIITAIARSIEGDILSLPPLTWTSDAPDVATVSGATGFAQVSAVGDGSAKITASGGGMRGQLNVRVHRSVASIALAAPSPTLVLGASMGLVATARDARQQPIEGVSGYAHASSAPGSVLMSSDGVATALFDFGGSPRRW